MSDPRRLEAIYEKRFQAREAYRMDVWRVLIESFFSRWVGPDATVLDLGCGYGEFINQVLAARRYGMDLNPATRARLAADVEFLEQDCSATWAVPPGTLDLVFTSNFFEHLPDKDRLAECLGQARRSLKPGGRLIALGPNIRLVNGRYWDFWDHHLPLTDLSLAEALRLAGFEILRRDPQFLPYTMSGGYQYPTWMVGAYLRVPFAWRLLGEQFLLVARRPLE